MSGERPEGEMWCVFIKEDEDSVLLNENGLEEPGAEPVHVLFWPTVLCDSDFIPYRKMRLTFRDDRQLMGWVNIEAKQSFSKGMVDRSTEFVVEKKDPNICRKVCTWENMMPTDE
jgi:hypothetical protein